MRNVAIVEDEKESAEKLRTFLERFGRECGEQFNIAHYPDAVAFLSEEHKKFDLVFMDIELPDVDGMEAAKRLRKTDPDVMIVFVTNMAQYAIKGYEVRAFDFIVKPVSYGNFSVKLRGAMDVLRARDGKYVWVSNMDGKLRLHTSAIKYVEVVQHMLIYHTTDGDIKASGSLNALETELADEPFALCNRCYFVNLRHVTAVRQFDVYLGNEKLQISRLKRASFMSALNDFLAGGGS